MLHSARILVLSLLALVGILDVPGRAQAPKSGDYYKDEVDLGFKVKMPKDWEFTPPQPNERYVVGKYTPPFNRYINISPSNRLWLEAYILKFDRRSDSSAEKKKSKGNKEAEEQLSDVTEDRHESLLARWLDERFMGSNFQVKNKRTSKIKKVPATEILFEGIEGGDPFHVYTMAYEIGPMLDLAVIFNGPEDKKKWRKYESSIKRMAKSFQPIEVKQLELSAAKDDDSSLRSLKRAELEMEAAKSADWKLYETDNYFVISNNDDREFMKEMMERLEAIRGVYEEIYPFDTAARLKVAAQKKEREERKAKGEPDPDVELDELGRAKTTSGYSSQQQSRCSVVRVCKNDIQYHEYGGPGGSAGYWHSGHEELVIYDDKSGGGRRNTWAVLNHEAFHQYIFYLYGSISPHSWYNEGTGDFFAGYEYKHKRFTLKPFAWRKDTIRTAIKTDEHVPLKDLVRFTQREYYGNNDYNVSGGQNYAQGWSFIYFLRTGRNKAPGWNDDWQGILDIYFETLASTEDLKIAVDTAFDGVDWEAMEDSWKGYTLK
jgi:hypothetical protein